MKEHKTKKQKREEDTEDFFFFMYLLITNDELRNDFIEEVSDTGKALEKIMKALTGEENNAL